MASPRIKKLMTLLVWIGIIAYLALAMPYSNQEYKKIEVDELQIIIDDSLNNGFITKNEIERLLQNSDLQYIKVKSNKIPLSKIEELINSHTFVKQADAYTDFEGRLTLEVASRRPIMRFNCNNQTGFYLTDDNYILPLSRNFVAHVPIITGEIDFPFESGFSGYFEKNDEKKTKKDDKNYEFLYKLANFVKFIRNDKFWDAQIVQIVVSKKSRGAEFTEQNNNFNYQIELVTRAGDSRIKLSSLDRYEQKLNKLMTFYHKALPATGWQGIQQIDLSFDGQIVVSSK